MHESCISGHLYRHAHSASLRDTAPCLSCSLDRGSIQSPLPRRFHSIFDIPISKYCTELQICQKSQRIGRLIPRCKLQCGIVQPILGLFFDISVCKLLTCRHCVTFFIEIASMHNPYLYSVSASLIVPLSFIAFIQALRSPFTFSCVSYDYDTREGLAESFRVTCRRLKLHITSPTNTIRFHSRFFLVTPPKRRQAQAAHFDVESSTQVSVYMANWVRTT